MLSDLTDACEVLLAGALAKLNRAGFLGRKILDAATPQDIRALIVARRAVTAYQAVTNAGIKLPPIHDPADPPPPAPDGDPASDTDTPPAPAEPEDLGPPWSFSKLAKLADVHRSTVSRAASRLEIAGGGDLTPEEAHRVLHALGLDALAAELFGGV